MKPSEYPPKIHAWNVSFTTDDERIYSQSDGTEVRKVYQDNAHHGVLAHTLEEAIEIVKTAFPGCRLVSVNKGTTIHQMKHNPFS